MSARDSESGSSSYKGGSGRAGGLGNGGIGGGMGGGGNYGGGMGGGAGRMGGIGSRTGLTTGNKMFGGMAFGRPGGNAMNPGAWGIRPQPAITQGPLLGNPTPASVPGVNPVPEDVPMPSVQPSVFNQDYLGRLASFRNMMNNRYGWGAAQPGPGPVNAPAPSGPPSWRNPTAFPQFSTGWKNQTHNYSVGNSYPGGLNYTREPGRDNTWSNDDVRFGIDKMARERGY